MSFLEPAAFAFLAAMPVVILFYLLKRRRTVRLVSSTLLWQKFLAESQASAPFQKLRKNWLLLLQLLLLALVILGMARPFVTGDARPASLRVIILDASASMQARDQKPSRFEFAQAEALKLVDGLKDQDRMVIVEAGAVTQVRQSATSDRSALKRALLSARPSDGPTRLVAGLRTAESLVRDQRDSEIHLFSDGAAPGLDEFANKALPLVYHRIGTGSNNVGITALDVRANPENPNERAIYAAVSNFSSNQVSTTLHLQFDRGLVETRPLILQPGEVSPQVFRADQDQDGIFRLQVDVEDDLPVDNHAWVPSFLPKPARVLLVTRGNRLLQRALNSLPRLQLAVDDDFADPGAEYDFVVLDNVVPSSWPKGNVMAIRVAHTNWLSGIRAIDAPALVDWRSSHPLLRYAGFENVQVMRSLAAPAPPWAVPLLESPQAPLILAGELQNQRLIWIGFDVLESTWPLRVAFPIFMANAAEWLNPASSRSAQFLVKSGDALRLPLTKPPGQAVVTFPSGATRTYALQPNQREFVFSDTQSSGVYKLSLGEENFAFCVNLLDPVESQITPRPELQLGNQISVAEASERKSNQELWRYLALLGFVVLLGEWWYYHRRTV